MFASTAFSSNEACFIDSEPTIAAGHNHTVGLKEDGTVVAVGANYYGQLNVSGWTNIKAIAGGDYHTVGLKEDGTVVAVGWNGLGQLNVSGWTNIKQPAEVHDITPPITTAAGGNGSWQNSDVLVSFSAEDDCSGVKEIQYIIDGVEIVVSGASAGIIIEDEGVYEITYFSVDNKGNRETPKSITVRIDKTPPAINLSADPSILWPPNHKMVNVTIGGGAEDSLSGVASVAFTVTDEYGSIEPKVSGFNTTIPLEAWRNGNDNDGRRYTITVVTTDNAGNSSTASTVVRVPHDQRK